MSERLTLIEMRELVALVDAKYGYDLGGYAEASLQRRFVRFLQITGLSLFDLKYRLTNDTALFRDMVGALTVNVTEMFRDPAFYKALAETVIPELAKLPTIRIWHAGCATGEEAYSMAILLYEAGLLSRTKIYATDVNRANLEKAEAGIIPLKKMRQYTTNYLQSGGKGDFSNYYTAGYDGAIINRELREQIVFSTHNLLADDVFNEFELICCRNVLIYFKSQMQARAIGLFEQSLSNAGFLALGSRESLASSGFQKEFATVDPLQKIYRRKTSTLSSDI
jgi:chemotaxis protein methyltransferase CheR